MERAAQNKPKLCESHEPRGKVLEFRVRLQELGVQERLARLEGLIDGVTMMTQSALEEIEELRKLVRPGGKP